jgi:hypothetical protein
MRLVIIFLILICSTQINSQIKIDDVGDDWKLKVEKSLSLIKMYDVEKYDLINNVCEHITYWNGPFSTTEDSVTIMITQKDMMSSINNIASILVHESQHLYFLKMGIKLNPNIEEVLCYSYELDFLFKIPSVEEWLIRNANNKIIYYQNLNKNKTPQK